MELTRRLATATVRRGPRTHLLDVRQESRGSLQALEASAPGRCGSPRSCQWELLSRLGQGLDLDPAVPHEALTLLVAPEVGLNTRGENSQLLAALAMLRFVRGPGRSQGKERWQGLQPTRVEAPGLWERETMEVPEVAVVALL